MTQVMTESVVPTDAEIEELIAKEMIEYSDGAYADHGSARSQLEYFARAIITKYEKLTMGNPVAYAVYDIKYGGSRSLHWADQHTEDGDIKRYKVEPLYSPRSRGSTTYLPAQEDKNHGN